VCSIYAPDDSDTDDASPAPGVHATASNFRSAGMSDSESDSSDVQFPELSNGVVENLDMDADPRMGPGPAQAELPEVQLPEVHLVDAAAGPDAPITYAEAGTREDGAIRAGLPCGIPAAVFAASVCANPGFLATAIADWLAPRPTDPSEL